MAFFRLRLKIWANGKLIAMATDFNSFIEMPSISKMDLDWKFFIMSTISAGLVEVNSRTGAFLVFIKCLGVTGVLLIVFSIFLPAVVKKTNKFIWDQSRVIQCFTSNCEF